MIEVCTKGSDKWRYYPKFLYCGNPPKVVDLDYRINGVVYRSRTNEFIEAYQKEIMWEKLL